MLIHLHIWRRLLIPLPLNPIQLFAALCLFVPSLGGCGAGSAGSSQGKIETAVGVLGGAVLYMCDQADVAVQNQSLSFEEYKRRVAPVRDACDRIAEAYDAVAATHVALTEVQHAAEACHAQSAPCVNEIQRLGVAADKAFAAGERLHKALAALLQAMKKPPTVAPEVKKTDGGAN